MDSLWKNSINFDNKFSKLDKSLDCDVCIVGGGIFGVSCAYYLSKAGLKVIVLEKDKIGSKTTGNTTAKITSQHGLFYDYLHVNNNAIYEIKNIVDLENIDCDFEFKDSFVYTTSESDLDAFTAEKKALDSLKFDCELTSSTYSVLENELFKYYPDANILFRWNTEDCISLDKLPYVGYYSNLLENVFVATGFKKWGMTLSNVSANIVCDMILGKKNEYSHLFDSTRINPIKNIDEVKNMAVDTTFSLIIDKLKIKDFDFSSIPVDSGKVIDIDGKKVGVYKDKNSNLQFVNPICTHLGCLLSWNDVDKTWDCPCHGSRFDYNGKNLYGPAFKNLEKF